MSVGHSQSAAFNASLNNEIENTHLKSQLKDSRQTIAKQSSQLKDHALKAAHASFNMSLNNQLCTTNKETMSFAPKSSIQHVQLHKQLDDCEIRNKIATDTLRLRLENKLDRYSDTHCMPTDENAQRTESQTGKNKFSQSSAFAHNSLQTLIDKTSCKNIL